MAIRKRIGKTGKVSYQIDYYTPEGERVRKEFEKKGDADDYLAKVKVSKKEKRYHEVFDVKEESQVTFNELAEKYLENFGTQKAFHRSKRYLLAAVTAHFGEKLLSQISYLDLETYRNQRKATPARGSKPRKDASVNREMALLGHMLNKAVEWDMLEASPFKKGKRLMLKENNHRLRFLTNEEIEALLKACSPHLRPIVEVALLTGMRRGELLGLKWDQIRNGFIYLTETKSGKARQIPINDRLAEVFKEVRHKKQNKGARVIKLNRKALEDIKPDPARAKPPPYVFCDFQGRRFHEVRGSFGSACKKAGINDFRFHDLRHTFASHLVMNGVSLKAVQELLGHADMKMTMRYAHLSQAHLREAVGVLDSIGRNGHKIVTSPEKERGADKLTAVNPS